MSDVRGTADPTELRNMAEAWPEDIFPTPPPDRQAKDAAAAHVLRVVAVPHLLACADEIEALRERVAKYESGIREIADECEADIPEDNGNATANLIGRHLRSLLDASHDQEDSRSLVTDDPLALAHQRHYQQCECLGDAAECCQPNCPCHDKAAE